jgi:DNA-binding SARP family transcriptional activator
LFGHHTCIFYDSTEQLWNICLPLIRDGMRDGLKCVYIADDHNSEEVKSVFESQLQSPGLFTKVVDATSLAFFNSPISINNIIRQLYSQVEAALAEGSSGLLLLIEMTWILRTWSGAAYLGEYEAAMQELISRGPMLRTICLYKRRTFPGSLLLDALRTHPYVYTEDGLHENPHFLPPLVFLSRDARVQFRWWLKTINPALTSPQPPVDDLPAPQKPSNAAARSSKKYSKAQVYNLESLTPLLTSDTDQRRWKIHCLGSLQIYRQDGTPVNWNAANGATLKAKTLFAYLLFRGQKGAAAEEIADLLWPEAKSMEQSLNRLYHTIHCLRIALSPELTSSRDSSFVLTRDQRYFLAIPKDTWIDTHMFEELCYQGEQLLREDDDEQALVCHLAAEKLYKGDLLEDIPLEYTTNIEQDWCWSQRYWLQEMYLKMLTYMAGIYRRRDDAHRASAYCEKALRIDPASERAHQEMMRIFHFTGRRDALERQYRLCYQALERFEGNVPSPATQALYQSLIATL